jgi:hypothetical protein
MSLGLAIKVPDGLVLAVESRIMVTQTDASGQIINKGMYDNATKLLSFKNHDIVGAVTYGLGHIGLRAHSWYLWELNKSLGKNRLPVYDFAQKLSDFFMKKWNLPAPQDYKGEQMSLLIAGFNKDEPDGHVYLLELPSKPEPIEQLQGIFSMSIGGQQEIATRLLNGIDTTLLNIINTFQDISEQNKQKIRDEIPKVAMQIPWNFLPLQDSVNLAVFIIQTTIKAQQFVLTDRGCGGAIHVCTITKDEGLKHILETIDPKFSIS